MNTTKTQNKTKSPPKSNPKPEPKDTKAKTSPEDPPTPQTPDKADAHIQTQGAILPPNAEAPATKSGDQTDAKPAKAGDQTDADKPVKSKKKKDSPTVIAWKAVKKDALPSGKIHILPNTTGKDQKRGEAMVRFRLYEEGMTPEEYVEKSHKAGNPKALAKQDVHWDIVKKLIEVK